MNEKLKVILKSAEDKMQSSLLHLENELLNIRAGKANPNMLKSVMVDYYGNPTAIAQLANINTPDSKSLVVQPWDKSILQEIEKGIINANLGFNPMNNGDTIIVSSTSNGKKKKRISQNCKKRNRKFKNKHQKY